MRFFKELCTPPAGKCGWPWEQTDDQSHQVVGKTWPKISVVTPSFNQAEYLEETMRSVLLQGYPNLEYIVLDGGSTDGSVEIIKKYSRFLSAWSSQRDSGQADAIQKGLSRCTGEWFNWINSDDLLAPDALFKVAVMGEGFDVVTGGNWSFGALPGSVASTSWAENLNASAMVLRRMHTAYVQPSTWLRRSHAIAVGGLDIRFDYVFDWELTVRYLLHYPRVRYIRDVLSFFRYHPKSKSVKHASSFEVELRKALSALAQRGYSEEFSKQCDRGLRKSLWWDRLAELRADRGNSGARLFTLCLECLDDPVVRLSRPTLGTARRLLMSGKKEYGVAL